LGAPARHPGERKLHVVFVLKSEGQAGFSRLGERPFLFLLMIEAE
jgi:hypothetical protein